MKQENVQKLISLVANYVDHVVAEDDKSYALDRVQLVTLFVNNHMFKTIPDQDKARKYHDTIMALNCGSDEAMEEAFFIHLEALCSGDDEFIEKIEYLWDVI